MDKPGDQEQLSAQNGNDLFAEVLKEMQELRAVNAKLYRRLSRLESMMEGVASDIKTLRSLPPSETNYETIDKFITEQIQSSLDRQDDAASPPEEAEPNWNYYIAQKGGFDEVLYMTVQDFLKLNKKNPAQLLVFLLEKRDKEVKESLEHLQTEYENLEGHQLQKHFTDLWELHHNLLKKKIIRTWKEEIFLEAFDAFLQWLQQ